MKRIMLGNEAVARGAYEAGITVAVAYPGTPSTEITEAIAKNYDNIYAEWSPNEKVALEVALGASFAGARSICSMKHVGLNVAADPLFTASYTGVNGGCVIMVADDPGMHSSQDEQDSRHYARASKVPMLEPSNSQECKDFVIEACRLSEKYDTPVIIRLTTRIAHSQSAVELGDKEDYKIKEYVKDPNKYVMMPGMAKKRHVFVEKRMLDLQDYANSSEINRVEWGNKKIGVITSGISYQYAKEAFGDDVSYLKLGMVNPLPDKLIKEFAKEVETLYVIEELDPYFEEYIKALGIKVTGKEKLTLLGEYSASLLREKFLGIQPGGVAIEAEAPGRPPVLCPGCPHRATFHVLNKLKVRVNGDIGCYTLGALPPTSAIDTCVCMGASIGNAHGMEKARGEDFARNTVAILGDSTFIHSGITGLIDIVYNKGTSTVIILDNSITGMTGHQQNPTTGFTIKGEPTKQVDLVLLAKAVGVERVRVADPFDMAEFEKVMKEELAANEPSVVIAQRPCALLKSVKFEGSQRVNTDKCTKCLACFRLGCPAIEKLEGGGVKINEALCVGCKLCNKVCKFNAIEKAGDN